MSRWGKIAGWLEAYGFAVLVLLAIIAAAVAGLTATIPRDAPLVGDSESLYSLLVGGVAFAVFYLGALAFVLALRGRGFTELGPRGVRANRVLRKKQQQALRRHEEAIEGLKTQLKQMSALTEALVDQTAKLEEELAKPRRGRELDSES